MRLLSDDSRDRIPALSTGDRVPLHPALTDVPVATFSLAPVFDAVALVTRSESAGAAGLWTGGAGVLWALPTAATGLLDYLRAPSGSSIKRIGLAHAALNTFALSMMVGSLVSRRFRSAPTPLSLVFSAAAGAAVTYSSHLGGVMVYREGMGVSGEGLAASYGLDEETTIGDVRSPLGSTGGEPATLGGAAEDSPDIGDTGIVAGSAGGDEDVSGPLDLERPPRQASDDLLVQTSAREQWDELDRLEAAVEEGADNPDDMTLEEGGQTGGERPDDETGGTSQAA